MRWLWVGVVLMTALGGCGQHAASEQSGKAAAPSVAAAGAQAGPPWYAVAGGVPTISGAVLVTAGPMSAQNGFDDDGHFQRVWSYTGRVLSAEVDINRAELDASKRDAGKWSEEVSRSAGHIVVPLPGIGDGGIAILDQKAKGAEHPLVRTYAYSGNASVSVLMYVDGVITDEADLTAHSAELIAALDEVLDDLRPR